MTSAQIVARCIALHDDINWEALTEGQQQAFIKRAALLLQKVVWIDGAKT